MTNDLNDLDDHQKKSHKILRKFENRKTNVVSSQCLSKEEVFKAPTYQEAFFGKKGALLREEGPFTSGRRAFYFGKKNHLLRERQKRIL
jgi:hypothetical protein